MKKILDKLFGNIERKNTSLIQSNNQVEGDLIGRDKIVYESTTELNRTTLEIISERLEESDVSTTELFETIDDLGRYQEDITEGEFKGLDAKLKLGDREDKIKIATMLKLHFAKKILKSSLSPKAQKVYVHILAYITNKFKEKVFPLIIANVDKYEVEKEISILVNDIYEQVGSSALDLTAGEIEGAIYYLTGNCYINWTDQK